MINLREIEKVYFIGIGGIGMSALAQYFHQKGAQVAGFDDILSPLTDLLSINGIEVSDSFEILSDFVKSDSRTLVIYTPAIPKSHKMLQYFIKNKFKIIKRAKALALIAREAKTIAVAGTHGKTTTCSMLSHIFISNNLLCTAFIGGLSKNFNNNLISKNDDLIIVEADEYDRSFLELSPDVAIVTSLDSDHLDVYKTFEDLKNAFQEFIEKLKPGGLLITNHSLNIKSETTYGMSNNATCFIRELILQRNGYYRFTIQTNKEVIRDVEIPVFGKHNLDNFLGALCIANHFGIKVKESIAAMQSYKGVERRFEVHLKNDDFVLIDDYAHHPVEIKSTLRTAKELFKKRKIMCVFQPHLYSRTRDYAKDFGKALSIIDELIVIDIYPAREEPIEGVDATIILTNASNAVKKYCSKRELFKEIVRSKAEVFIMLGAGDISELVKPVKEVLLQKLKAA